MSPELKLEQLDTNHKDMEELLLEAESSEDILTDWERDEFVPSIRKQLARRGNLFEPSSNQQMVLNNIRDKLEREGVL